MELAHLHVAVFAEEIVQAIVQKTVALDAIAVALQDVLLDALLVVALLAQVDVLHYVLLLVLILVAKVAEDLVVMVVE